MGNDIALLGNILPSQACFKTTHVMLAVFMRLCMATFEFGDAQWLVIPSATRLTQLE